MSAGTDPHRYPQDMSAGTDPHRYPQDVSAGTDPHRYPQDMSAGTDPHRYPCRLGLTLTATHRTCRLGERLLKENEENKTAAACSAEALWGEFCKTPYSVDQKNLTTCYYYFEAHYNDTHYEPGIAGMASGAFQSE